MTDAAQALGVTRTALSRVLNGKAGISPEMALRLELAFSKPSAEHWLRLQNAYDLWLVREQQAQLQVQPYQLVLA
mgnify:CR=1 FL=1